MTRPHTIVRLLVATACVTALLTAPAVAEDKTSSKSDATWSMGVFTGGDAILSVIPKNSTAFAVVNGLEMADQVCKELGEATQLPIPSPVMILKQATGLGDSLKMKGNMAVVLYIGDAEVQGPPPMLAVLPIADHKKMLAQFDAEKVTDAIQKITINGNDVLVAEKEGFTIVAQESDQNVLEAFLAAKESIAAEMKPWKAWTDTKIVYGIVTNYGIKESMKGAIESLEGTLESFEQFGESSPQLDQIKKSLGIYVMVMKGIRDNANQIGAGLSTTSNGAIKISARCDATSDSKFAKMLEDVKALPIDPMTVVPEDKYAFAGGGPIPKQLVAILMELSQGMGGGQLGLDAEQNAEIIKLSIAAMKSMTGEAMVFGTPAETDNALADGAYVTMWVTDADKYLTDYVKQIKAMNDLFAKADKPTTKMEAKETTIDGNKVVVATTDISGMVSNPELAPAAELLKSFYGKDLKITAYIAKVNDTLLVSAIGNEDHLKKAIEVAKSKSGSLAENAVVKEVAAMLPKDAQWTMYWSPVGTVELANWVIAKLPEQLKANMPFEKLPPFPPCPPVGIAVEAGNGSIEKTVVLPPGTLRSAMMYFMQIQMMGAH